MHILYVFQVAGTSDNIKVYTIMNRYTCTKLGTYNIILLCICFTAFQKFENKSLIFTKKGGIKILFPTLYRLHLHNKPNQTETT